MNIRAGLKATWSICTVVTGTEKRGKEREESDGDGDGERERERERERETEACVRGRRSLSETHIQF